jgi:hypothetical protein
MTGLLCCVRGLGVVEVACGCAGVVVSAAGMNGVNSSAGAGDGGVSGVWGSIVRVVGRSGRENSAYTITGFFSAAAVSVTTCKSIPTPTTTTTTTTTITT